jgi:hypothetical protein
VHFRRTRAALNVSPQLPQPYANSPSDSAATVRNFRAESSNRLSDACAVGRIGLNAALIPRLEFTSVYVAVDNVSYRAQDSTSLAVTSVTGRRRACAAWMGRQETACARRDILSRRESDPSGDSHNTRSGPSPSYRGFPDPRHRLAQACSGAPCAPGSSRDENTAAKFVPFVRAKPPSSGSPNLMCGLRCDQP